MKITKYLFAFAMVFCFIFGLSACGSKNKVKGIEYKISVDSISYGENIKEAIMRTIA